MLNPEDGVNNTDDDSDAVTGLFGKLLVVVSTGVAVEEDAAPVP